MADEQIEIGNKKFSWNSLVKLDIKTAFYILSLLWAVACWGYYDLKKSMQESEEKFSKQKQELFDKIYQSTDARCNKTEDRIGAVQDDVNSILREQGDIKGDIKVILDRTMSAGSQAKGAYVKEEVTPH